MNPFKTLITVILSIYILIIYITVFHQLIEST